MQSLMARSGLGCEPSLEGFAIADAPSLEQISKQPIMKYIIILRKKQSTKLCYPKISAGLAHKMLITSATGPCTTPSTKPRIKSASSTVIEP
jgi:hypothetical protein